ncbi:hypothetical protein D1872_178400 [compost metagenome]
MDEKKMMQWETHEDEILITSVLDKVSKGGTVVEGCEEASDVLQRPVGGCKNRWYHVLLQENRENYNRALRAAGRKVKYLEDQPIKRIPIINKSVKADNEISATNQGEIYSIEYAPKTAQELYQNTLNTVGDAFDALITAHLEKDQKIRTLEGEIEVLNMSLYYANENLESAVQENSKLASTISVMEHRIKDLEGELEQFATVFNLARKIAADEPVVNSRKYKVGERGDVEFAKEDGESGKE